MNPMVMPPSMAPMAMGLSVSPTCAPVRCVESAKPRRSGYFAANVPNAGACHRLVPNPITLTVMIISQYHGETPTIKYPVPTRNMLAPNNQATLRLYMSVRIPAGTFATPLAAD